MQKDMSVQSHEADRETTGADTERVEHKHSSHHSKSSSHSSHSHHGKSHSSSHKKNGSSKQPFLKKIAGFIDKQISKKANIVICAVSLVVVSVLMGSIYAIETSPKESPDDSQGNVTPGNSEQWENFDNSANTETMTIPPYWKQMIDEKTKMVKTLHAMGGKNCVSFVWASDTHIPDNHTARTDYIGKLMAQIMDNCSIPFAILTGDIGTRSSYDTEAELVKSQTKIPVHLAPLWGTERLLVAVGNHDGCFGDASCYYQKQFSPDRMWDLYFRNQALDFRRVFSEDGTYFYIDNPAQKIRFIVLNSHFSGEYITDDNGIAENNRFEISCYGQEQLDWLANIALDMPEEYGAVIAAHVPPNMTYTVDNVQLIGIINAYCKKTTYSGSYTLGTEGWTNNQVNVDFRNAKGEIIAMLAGHIHEDTIDTTTLACPLITIISAGAETQTDEIPERIFETDTETSFDVVTIDRETRTIYFTRVGYGVDRIVEY